MFDGELLSLSLEKNIKNFYEIKKRSTILDLKINNRKLKSTKLIKMMKMDLILLSQAFNKILFCHRSLFLIKKQESQKF